MTGGRNTERHPGWVVIADLLAVVALGLTAWVWLVGPIEFDVGGRRISMSRPGRGPLLALALIALRTWRVGPPGAIVAARRYWNQLTHKTDATLFGRFSSNPLGECATVTTLLIALVALATWPQVTDLSLVPDVGDPTFSAWRLSWVAHQLPRDPWHLFDANTFYPERLTLTYSDSMLVPSLLAAPFLWMGAPAIPTTQALFLAAWVGSGLATYYLVRALTSHRPAALVAGVMFALLPFRSEHYSHLELQFAMWMPLACWAIHRTIARGRVVDGVLTGLAIAAQFLSSLYFGLFLSVFLLPLGFVLWWSAGRPLAPIRALAVGAAVAFALVAPVAVAYIANGPMFGQRSLAEIEFYSAFPADYLRPHLTSAAWGQFAEGSKPERALFPGLAALVLAGVGAFRSRSRVVTWAYVFAGAVALDISLGLHGFIYPTLHAWVSPFRGLRVPARSAILVGFSLSVLAGFAVASWRIQRRRRRALVTSALIAVVFIDMRPALQLRETWAAPPRVYAALSSVPGSVLAEFPVATDAGGVFYDHYYTYFSTSHWHRTLNGASGFMPPSWYEFEAKAQDFPSDGTMAYLRKRGVGFVAVHEALYANPRKYADVKKDLSARADVVRVASAHFEGGQSELYRLLP